MQRLYFFITSLILIICPVLNHAQSIQFEWANSIGTSSLEEGYAIAEDSEGNIIITGVYGASIDLDPGMDIDFHSYAGGFDFYIIKLDADGNHLWSNSYGGTGDDESYAITTDDEDRIFVTGVFQSTVNFEPATNDHIVTSSSSQSGFLLALDSNGEFLWVNDYQSDQSVTANETAVDEEGNLLFTGHFAGNLSFDVGSGIDPLVAGGSADLFAIKIANDGSEIWARRAGGSSLTLAAAISSDGNNNVLITGTFIDSVDLDPGPGISDHFTQGNRDIFVLKLDSDGNFTWAGTMGGSGTNATGFSIKTDLQGDIYTTGRYVDTVDFDPGPGIFNLETTPTNASTFIQKLSAEGDLIWAKTTEGPSYDIGRNLRLDNAGNIYVCGLYRGTVDFDPGLGVFNLVSNTNTSTFIQKIDPDGNLLWARSFLTNSNTTFGTGRNDMVVSDDGGIYITGKFSQTVDFDPEASLFEISSENNSPDAYVLKLRDCPAIESEEFIEECFEYTWPANNETYNFGGNYVAILSAANGCDSIVTLNLIIYEVFTSVSQDGFTLTSDQSGASYQWLDCNNGFSPITGATNQSYTVTESGSYAVEVNFNGCIDTSDCIDVTGVGYSEIDVNDFLIFPNPSNEKIWIDIVDYSQIFNVNISSLDGRLIHQENELMSPVEIYLPESSGIFLIEILSESGSTIKIEKLVKR